MALPTLTLAALTLAAAPGQPPAPAPAPPVRRGAAELRILGVNDLHGNLEPPSPEAGGAAVLAAHLRRAEAGRPGRTLTLHAGDMVGASPLVSAFFRDEPTVDATNAMGFDAGTLGNHELDDGVAEALRLTRRAEYPYVAANVVDRATGRPLLAPHVVAQRDGVAVGVIGVTTPDTPNVTPPGTVDGLAFTDLSDAVNREAAVLEARGVRTIVVLAHAGGAELLGEAAQMSPAVDVVLGGHTHERLEARVGGVLVVEAGRYGEAFGQVDLTVDRATGDVVGSRSRIVATAPGAVKPDRALARRVRALRARIAPFADRVVARAAAAVPRFAGAQGVSPLGALVAEAQRAATGAEVALVNPGSIRAELDAGPITFGELYAAQPTDRDLVRLTLTGAQLRRVLEQQFAGPRPSILQTSGLTWDEPAPGTVGAIAVGGAPVRPDAEYAVAANASLAAGQDGFTAMAGGRHVEPVAGTLAALVEHLERLPQPLAAPPARVRAAR